MSCVATVLSSQFNLSDHTANQTLGISEQYQYEDGSVHMMRNATIHAQSVQANQLHCGLEQRDLCAKGVGKEQELSTLRQTVTEQAERLAALEAVVVSLQYRLEPNLG